MVVLQTRTQTNKKQTANNEKELQRCKHCKKRMSHKDDNCYHLDKNKDKRPQWNNNISANEAKSNTNKSKKADWQGPGSRMLSNLKHDNKIHVEHTKVNTTITHETLLTAQVEGAEQWSCIFLPKTNTPHKQTAVIDSGATSSCGRPHDPLLATGQLLYKIFHTPFRQQTAASKQKELLHNLPKPVRTIDIIPTLKYSPTLLSTSKFADTNYITVLTPQAVHIYICKQQASQQQYRLYSPGRETTSGGHGMYHYT